MRTEVNGTPAYMAPELFLGKVSKRSDQYALGCIAYELLIGRPPFTAPDAIAMGFKHLRERPIPPTRLNPGLSPHLESVILKALVGQPGIEQVLAKGIITTTTGSNRDSTSSYGIE